MEKPPYDITPKIVSLIAAVAEQVGRINVLAVPDAVRLRRLNRARAVHSSLAVEGNSMTYEQVTAVMDGDPVLAAPREVQEIRNAIKAYEQMERWNPYAVADLRAAHTLLMTGLADETGEFRRLGVGIKRGDQVVHVAPPAERVGGLVENLLEYLQTSDDHPLIRGCVFHYEFEFIHPFADGNGRLGRLWQTLFLSRWQPLFAMLPVESIVHDRQSEYYRALVQSDAVGKSTAFIEFMLSAIRTALASVNLHHDQAIDQVSDQVSVPVKRLLGLMSSSGQSALQLMRQLGLKHRSNFRRHYLDPALAAGWIEPTAAGKHDARQQYRLTPAGRELRFSCGNQPSS